MNRADLQRLTRLRLSEARMLLANKKYEAAYYLAGYAVECAFKACVAKQVRKFDFPDKKLILDSYTHNLEQLLNVSGLRPSHRAQVRASPDFAVNWAVVKDWSEDGRYVLDRSAAKAKDLYRAIAARPHGVLTWLKRHW